MASGASSSQPPPGHTRSTSFFSSFRRQTSNDVPQRSNSIMAKMQQNGPNSPPPPPQQQMQQREQLIRGSSSQGQQPMGSPLAQTMSAPSPSPTASGPPAQQSLHPEIRSVVQLTVAHARKIYFSGPLVRRIERQPDGQRPAKDEGWTEVWAQLGGTTLSIWDMAQVQEASKQGKEVPPTYVNMTDAVSLLGFLNVSNGSWPLLVCASTRISYCA